MHRLSHSVQKWSKFFVKKWNKFFVISCLVSIFIDSLFMFRLSVAQDNKCIVLNWSFAIALAVARSLTDFIYFICMLFQFWQAFFASEYTMVGGGDFVDQPKKIALRYLRGYFIFDLFGVLPLPLAGSIRFPEQRLLSDRTVTCLTDVEALTLGAADLEEVAALFARFLQNSLVQRAIRYESPYWRNNAATRIQVAWRHRQRRLTQIESSNTSAHSSSLARRQHSSNSAGNHLLPEV